VRHAVVVKDRLAVRAPVAFDVVEISGTTERSGVEVELSRYGDGKLDTHHATTTRVPAGRTLRLVPSSWERLPHAKVEEQLS
jgi:hypothetical protein